MYLGGGRMDKRKQIIREWRESTEEGIAALQTWRGWLEDWEASGGECVPGNFDDALRALVPTGLDKWADINGAGGGLDLLAAAVRGEELPEPEPVTRDAMLKAIFGGDK